MAVHPFVARHLDLFEQVKFAAASVPDLELGPIGLLHSDLHGAHVYTGGRRLTSVIDFGGAFIGPISWEFAPVALFLGWNTADRLLATYSTTVALKVDFWNELHCVALLFALYRYSAEDRAGRLATEGPPIVRFIRETAKRIDGST